MYIDKFANSQKYNTFYHKEIAKFEEKKPRKGFLILFGGRLQT